MEEPEDSRLMENEMGFDEQIPLKAENVGMSLFERLALIR